MDRDVGTLARALRALRAEQGLAQLDVAVALGAGDASYLSRLENGRAVNPSVSFLSRYVHAFAVLGRPLSREQVLRLLHAAVIEAADSEGSAVL